MIIILTGATTVLPSLPPVSLYVDDAVHLADVCLRLLIKHTAVHLHASTDAFDAGGGSCKNITCFDSGYSNAVNLHNEPDVCLCSTTQNRSPPEAWDW